MIIPCVEWLTLILRWRFQRFTKLSSLNLIAQTLYTLNLVHIYIYNIVNKFCLIYYFTVLSEKHSQAYLLMCPYSFRYCSTRYLLFHCYTISLFLLLSFVSTNTQSFTYDMIIVFILFFKVNLIVSWPN